MIDQVELDTKGTRAPSNETGDDRADIERAAHNERAESCEEKKVGFDEDNHSGHSGIHKSFESKCALEHFIALVDNVPDNFSGLFS